MEETNDAFEQLLDLYTGQNDDQKRAKVRNDLVKEITPQNNYDHKGVDRLQVEAGNVPLEYYLAEQFLDNKDELQKAGFEPRSFFLSRKNGYSLEDMCQSQGTSLIWFNPNLSKEDCEATLQELYEKGILAKPPKVHYGNTKMFAPTYYVP